MAQRNVELLKALLDAHVEFVVIGGVAANVLGTSGFTKDLDVCARLSVTNCRRILEALGTLRPRFYQTMGKPPVDRTAEQLAEFKNLYFETDWGVIDLLGSVPPVGDYERVAAGAEAAILGELQVRVIGLDDLIAVKAHVGRPKDKLAEVELRAIRELRNATGKR